MYELMRQRKDGAKLRTMNDDERQAKRQRSAKQEENRIAKGGAKKKSGIQRRIKSKKKKYDAFFIQLLREVTQIWIRECGLSHVYSNDLVQLFDKILVNEKENITTVVVTFVKNHDGKLVVQYLEPEYENVCNFFMEKRGKQYHFKAEYLPSATEMDEAAKKRSRIEVRGGKATFMDHVVTLLYAEKKMPAAQNQTTNKKFTVYK